MKPITTCLLLFLAFVAGVMPAKAIAAEPLAAACAGKQPLYTPPDPGRDSNVLFPGMAGGLQFLQSLPVAFTASGDPCLGPVPVYRISQHIFPERDTHAMARRLAPEMQEFSQRTGEEACARMCKTPAGTIVAQLVTLHAHVVCLAQEDTCPAGSTPTPETIHSHPPQTVFVANAVDELGWEEPGITGKLTLTGYPDSLSPNDRQQAPVWLVGTRGQLIWLETPEGRETERP